MKRILGSFEGDEKGPLVILLGGMHGNEVAGVRAINEVFRVLEEGHIPIKGKIVGISGNLKALEENKRFIDYDLNRVWNDGYVSLLLNDHEAFEYAEDLEGLHLYETLTHHSRGDYTTRILVDLHTTSAENGNFIVIPEDEANNAIVKALHLPVVVDLDKYLEGTLLKFMHDQGYISFAFEGGQIGSSKALLLHTSGIWEVLNAAGSIEPLHNDEFDKYSRVLKEMAESLPKTVKVLYRHYVDDGDAFRMINGYHNFQKVSKGEVLAEDKFGKVTSPLDGMIFMPLYQEAGNDGFFIVEEVS